MDAPTVAREGYNGMMRGKIVVVPELRNKLDPDGGAQVPRSMIAKLSHRRPRTGPSGVENDEVSATTMTMTPTRDTAWNLLTEYTRARACGSMRWPWKRPCAAMRGNSARTRKCGCRGAPARFRLRAIPGTRRIIHSRARKFCASGATPSSSFGRFCRTASIPARRASRGSSTRSLPATRWPGFVTAAALVRPSKSVRDLEPASVVKRMKDKAFARGVSRDDFAGAPSELGIPLEEHIANVIASCGSGRTRSGCRARFTSHSGTERDLPFLRIVSCDGRSLGRGNPPECQRTRTDRSGRCRTYLPTFRSVRSACWAPTAPGRAPCSRLCSASSGRTGHDPRARSRRGHVGARDSGRASATCRRTTRRFPE